MVCEAGFDSLTCLVIIDLQYKPPRSLGMENDLNEIAKKWKEQNLRQSLATT